MAKNIYLHISAFDEPNIGVMECNPTDGVDCLLLQRILIEHFDVDCQIVEIKPNRQEGKNKWVVDVWVDNYNLDVYLEPIFIYHL